MSRQACVATGSEEVSTCHHVSKRGFPAPARLDSGLLSCHVRCPCARSRTERRWVLGKPRSSGQGVRALAVACYLKQVPPPRTQSADRTLAPAPFITNPWNAPRRTIARRTTPLDGCRSSLGSHVITVMTSPHWACFINRCEFNAHGQCQRYFWAGCRELNTIVAEHGR